MHCSEPRGWLLHGRKQGMLHVFHQTPGQAVLVGLVVPELGCNVVLAALTPQQRVEGMEGC